MVIVHWVVTADRWHDITFADTNGIGLTAKLKWPYFEIPFAVSVNT